MHDPLSAYFQMNRRHVLGAAALLIAVIAWIDWFVVSHISFGIMYLVPILLVAGVLNRWPIAAVCMVCAVLREALGPPRWNIPASLERMSVGLVTFLAAGFFASELSRRQEQARLRQEAEEQLRILIETSPAAILTVDSDARILLANQAAHRLLGYGELPLTGQPVGQHLPVLTTVARPDRPPAELRTMIEDRGRRLNGDPFLAHIWFSTYRTAAGPRLAAIVLDASEDLRERQQSGMQWLQVSSRTLVSAVSHEVRNLCWAITVLYSKMGRLPAFAESEDFMALGLLVDGLGKIATSELRTAPESTLSGVRLHVLFDELRIVIGPSLEEAGARMAWDLPPELPPARAEQHGLLQVFLNLAQNSLRAMSRSEQKQLTISAVVEGRRILVRVQDTGPGVAAPERLFQLFQPGAEASGLGLYISRAMVRSFGGDLRYQPRPVGCCFVVELAFASGEKEAYDSAAV